MQRTAPQKRVSNHCKNEEKKTKQKESAQIKKLEKKKERKLCKQEKSAESGTKWKMQQGWALTYKLAIYLNNDGDA